VKTLGLTKLKKLKVNKMTKMKTYKTKCEVSFDGEIKFKADNAEGAEKSVILYTIKSSMPPPKNIPAWLI